jgi:hypothetical protein
MADGNGASGGGEFTCPECGRTFARAAAMGAHRRRAHGVAGSSGSSARGTRAGRTTAAARRSRAASQGNASSSSAPQRARRTRGGAAAANGTRVNRDALLQTLFPSGIPAREEVVRAVAEWLDQAERLARMK